MPSAGARRKGPQGPELLVQNIRCFYLLDCLMIMSNSLCQYLWKPILILTRHRVRSQVVGWPPATQGNIYILEVQGPTGPSFQLLRRALGGPSGPHWGPFGPPSPHKIVLKSFLHKQMTEKITYKSWAKKLAKNVKNCFFKMHFMTTSKNVRQIPKPFLERFFLVVF